MPNQDRPDADAVPRPGGNAAAEHRGEQTLHNRGYDEAADGTASTPVDPLDE